MLAFLVAVLTVYWFTLTLFDEVGPFRLLEKWHNWLDGNYHQYNPGFDGDALRALRDLFSCYHCLSFWIALPVALALTLYLDNWFFILTWPALSGGAILVYEVAHGKK